MSILDDILEDKQEEVTCRRRQMSLDDLKRVIASSEPTRGFASALWSVPGGIALIAEVKKASPSKGVIRAEFDPYEIARIYASNGASALSVLTDEKYFKGRLEYLSKIRSLVPQPLLRKDFIVDEYQIYESRAAGADAVLLIVAALSPIQLQEYHALARDLRLDVLIEVHTEPELFIALDIGAALIGVNNRDLHTFKTDLSVTERLAPMLPEGALLVSESGIEDYEDVLRVKQAGARAILVGESLMRADDIAVKMRSILGEMS